MGVGATRQRIGELLVRSGHIGLCQLHDALADQCRSGGKLGDALVRRGAVSGPTLLEQLGRQLGVQTVELAGRVVRRSVIELLPGKLIRSRSVLPIAHASRGRSGLLVVATTEPQNLALRDELAFAAGKEIELVLADEDALQDAIRRHLAPDLQAEGEVALRHACP